MAATTQSAARADEPAQASQPSEPTVDFDRDVKPILSSRCFECHGPDTQENELRLDRRAEMLRGGKSGKPAVVPGKSGDSRLVQLVSGADPDRVMPPDGKRLSEKQIALIRTWIDQGAKWPETINPDPSEAVPSLNADFWSLRPLVRPQLPAVDGGRVENPIDAFILDRLKQAGLEPSPTANRATLIRRLYLDVLGLPPTPEELLEFENDARPDAYDRLVDSVLGNVHFGERWARHWLDVVRFAETSGFETNVDRPNAWYYRDYVINAFNSDKPFDQFVFEQLAGDSVGVDAATGFLVGGPDDGVKSPDIALTLMQRQDELSDMINTTGTAFLGLTLGCAKCHNHKFDPVLQKDYYAVQAVFAGVRYGERPLRNADTAQRIQEADAVNSRIEAIEAELASMGVRQAVNARKNFDKFKPVLAKFVRLNITATNNDAEPCLDELEIYAKPDGARPARNVALASEGAVATASGSLAGFDIHKLEHVNDGKYGNPQSWISNERGRGVVEIELAQPVLVNQVVWGRDRDGKLTDRLPVAYSIDVAADDRQWQTVATSNTRIPFGYGTSAQVASGFFGLDVAAAERVAKLLSERSSLNIRRKTLSETPAVFAGVFEQPGATHRLFRGDPLAPREVVAPDAITVLGKLNLAVDTPEQERRAAFARWIAGPDNPLTARVIVNRLWQFHFGTGIVDTPSDFGKNGGRPSHPELLDWLATELIRGGWSLKHVHRLILTSATYRQSSAPDPAKLTVDAGSRLLWRYPPRRLEAESIRDSILAVTGALDMRMGGTGFSLFEPNTNYVRVYTSKEEFGPAEWRRMIYATKVRMEHDSVFGVLDCPDAGQVTPKRTRSTTAIQALNLFNSRFTDQQSKMFAERLAREAGTDRNNQVSRAFLLAYGRKPDDREAAAAVALVDRHGLPALCRAVLNSSEFLFLP
ncbi:MAG: PSD1 and planctomycete cytochrome C domain-containing protein [Planctomycetaceae bacterium]